MRRMPRLKTMTKARTAGRATETSWESGWRGRSETGTAQSGGAGLDQPLVAIYEYSEREMRRTRRKVWSMSERVWDYKL